MNPFFEFRWRYLLFTILFLSIFLSYYSGLWYFRAVTLSFGLVCLCWLRKQSNLNNKDWFIFFVGTLGLFSSISFIHTQGVSFVVFLILVSQLAMAVCFFKIHGVSRLITFSYILFLTFTIFMIMLFDYGKEDFNTFFFGVSRNGYSAILFALMIGYCVRQVTTGKAISIFLVLLTFLVMFPLYGRTSIVATGMVLLGAIFRRVGHRFYISYLLLPILVGIGMQVFDLTNLTDLTDIADATNFRSGVESERWVVIEEWLDGLEPLNLLIGVDLSSLDKVNELDGNPHNAFIRLQSIFGAGILALIGVLVASFWYIVLDRKYFLLILFVTIIFKSFFDIIFLVGDLDFLLYPVLFYVFFRPYFSDRASCNI